MIHLGIKISHQMKLQISNFKSKSIREAKASPTPDVVRDDALFPVMLEPCAELVSVLVQHLVSSMG